MSRLGTAVRGFAVLASAVAIGTADYFIGEDFEIAPLFLLPVLATTWWFGRWPGIVLSLLGGAAFTYADEIAHGGSILDPHAMWFFVSRTVGFIVAAELVARLRIESSVLRRRGGVLEHELRARKDYTDLVAHEVRNPLVGIKAAATVLSRERGGEDLLERVRKAGASIASESEAGLTLLDDLRDASRIEADSLQMILAPIDVMELVRAATQASGAQSHPINLEGPARLMVLADRARLAQVLRNLLANATKYSEPGMPIDVVVGMLPAGGFALVTIRDRGRGIPPAERRDLFTRFKRLSTAAGTQGSGLGLYISRAIVEGHGGEIGFDAPAGGGSLFHFTVPLP